MSWWLTHPPEGDLRAVLDHELGSARLQRHLASCPTCRARLTTLERTARETQQLLSAVRAAVAKSPVPTISWEEILPVQRTMPRLFPAAVGAAVLALFAATLLVDPLRTAAANWLSIFRTQKIAYVETSPQAIANAMDGLEQKLSPELIRKLAQVSGPEKLPPMETTTPEAAAALMQPLLQPAALPAGLPAEPTRWGARLPATFTLRPDVDAINNWLYDQGIMASLDPKLKGQTFQVVTPTMVARQWRGADGRSLMIVQATSLQVSGTDRVDLSALAGLMGQLAGAPASVIDQIGQIPDLAHTLPLPAGPEMGEKVTIGQAQGVYYPRENGGALVWQQDGFTYYVGGNLTRAELLAVAVR
ncbi:MAG TPA: DUF4367 domain-containing protein [Symbiobacteriaceae bacterium]|nr:DUF4367 domain-containing protein [Symbiobacteriaceae bacterium]